MAKREENGAKENAASYDDERRGVQVNTEGNRREETRREKLARSA